MDEIDKEPEKSVTISENPSQPDKTQFKDKYWGFLLLELLVVFLGVTAGFLLNNWQEKNNELALEKKYINGFSQDINDNITELEEKIEEDSLWIKRTTPMILALKIDSLSVDSASAVIELIANVNKLNLVKGTYEDIINSGNLNLITDFNLKSMIVNYYLEVSGFRFIEDYFYSYFRDYVIPFLFKNFNVLNKKLINSDILKSQEFSNVFSGYFSMMQQSLGANISLLEKGYKLRVELKKFTSE